MILFHLNPPGREAAGVSLFSGSTTVFCHTADAVDFMEGG